MIKETKYPDDHIYVFIHTHMSRAPGKYEYIDELKSHNVRIQKIVTKEKHLTVYFQALSDIHGRTNDGDIGKVGTKGSFYTVHMENEMVKQCHRKILLNNILETNKNNHNNV